MNNISNTISKKPWLAWVLFFSTMVVVFLLGLFTYTIIENRTEGQFAFATTTDIEPLDPRAEAWGRFFPRQFNTYSQMADTTFRSKHLGSQRRDLLDENPNMVILFAGYGFSRDYNLARGHYYSVQDVQETLRTGAPMIKAQHPDYEIFTTGIHYQRGVSCADCHMPYKTEGGMKFTDHKIQSPLNNITASCQTCHRQSESELLRNVYDRQDMVNDLKKKLEEVLVTTHLEAEFAWNHGASENQMRDALHLIRHAQWHWDYAAASHGGAFHAPLEMVRTLGNGLDMAHKARRKITSILVNLGHTGDIPLPDVSSKEKAQVYIGIDLDQLQAEKDRFLEEIVPQWLQTSLERQARWETQRRDPDHSGSYLQ